MIRASSRRSAWASLALGLVMPMALASGAAGKDYYLTIGGGYSPRGNQISLEKNVLFFQRILAERHPQDAPRHDVLFSDGDSPGRDVQYSDPALAAPRVRQLLARVFDQAGGLEHDYRSHQVPGVRSASSREELNRWYQDVGKQIVEGDRLFIYLTGHGGKGDDEQNPHFYMWNNERMPVRDFTTWLDQFPASVPVTMVMVQCFSGGFANVLFTGGEAKLGASPARRAGFFATVHNRPAAGCTPDIREENYHEYSSAFWSALYGATRTGEPVSRPDYDANGQVSFAEAHAFTLLTSDTIDISVKTSDAFLRSYSKMGPEAGADALSIDSPYDALLAAAQPVDRAVLEGLSSQLALSGAERARESRELAEKIEGERKQMDERRKELDGQYDKARDAIADVLRFRWPETASPWHPRLPDLIASDGEAMLAAIEGHEKYSEFASLEDQLQQVSTQHLDLERKWVKCQRLLRALENVALAANLPKVAGPDVCLRYTQLVEQESITLP